MISFFDIFLLLYYLPLMKKITIKRRLIIVIKFIGLSVASIFLVYMITKNVFKWHFGLWGDKLIKLEKQGELSKDYDIWKIELEGDTLDSIINDILKKDDTLYIESRTPNDSVNVEN
jgi:hypothetical protein